MTPAEKLSLLNDNITNLKRKHLLPKQTLGYWSQDLTNLKKLVSYTDKQTFQEWSCPVCAITVYGPKKLLLEHHKIHSQRKEIGENETHQQEYKLY